MAEEIILKKGNILASNPFHPDPCFKRSIILVSDLGEHGTCAITLNKITTVTLNQAVEDFPQFDAPLYFGGPIDSDVLFYIHTVPHLLEDSKHITENLYFGGDYDRLKLLVDTRQIKPSDIRFYSGYAGWYPEELEHEIYSKYWFVGEDTTSNIFFDPEPENLWPKVIRRMDGPQALLAHYPDDPSEN